jgi:hypothetical protein
MNSAKGIGRFPIDSHDLHGGFTWSTSGATRIRRLCGYFLGKFVTMTQANSGFP